MEVSKCNPTTGRANGGRSLLCLFVYLIQLAPKQPLIMSNRAPFTHRAEAESPVIPLSNIDFLASKVLISFYYLFPAVAGIVVLELQ